MRKKLKKDKHNQYFNKMTVWDNSKEKSNNYSK